MSQHELLEKIESGMRLTPAELALLDMYLEEGSKSRVADAVRSLVHEEPSLAWRSALNERLNAIAARPKRSFGRVLAWGGASGAVGAAAVLAIAVFGGGQPTGEELTAELMVQWHEEAKASSILPVDSAGLAGFSEDHDPFESDDIDDLLYGDPLHSL